MIREGGILTVPSGGFDGDTNVLLQTQFSTITDPMNFVVRLINLQTPDVRYIFRRGSDRMSQGVVSVASGGIGAAEDAEVFRGLVGKGNLYLELSGGTNDNKVMYDITAY